MYGSRHIIHCTPSNAYTLTMLSLGIQIKCRIHMWVMSHYPQHAITRIHINYVKFWHSSQMSHTHMGHVTSPIPCVHIHSVMFWPSEPNVSILDMCAHPKNMWYIRRGQQIEKYPDAMHSQRNAFQRRAWSRGFLLYGVATISRLLKLIGLFCRIQSLLSGSFANETCHFKESTNRSHPITRLICRRGSYVRRIQGGEDPQDALSCRSFLAKEPLIIGLFCGK